MPLPTFNWIDTTNFPTGPENAGRQMWVVTRIGNDLYALLAAASGASLPLYKSADSGSTWSLLDNTLSISGPNNGGGLYCLYTGTDLLIRLMTSDRPSNSGSTSLIYFNQYDPVGLSWASTTNIGGGLPANQHGADVIDSASLFEFRRSDGSRIIAYESAAWVVKIIKQSSGGAWTTLATIDDTGSGRVNYLFGGIADTAGNIHLFGNVYQNSDICDLWHISVSTADVVSSRHTIESGLEDQGFGTVPAGTDNPMSTAAGRIGLSADGTKIAYVYGKNSFSRYSTPSLIELHVAIGDLSSTPLDPSWAVETAATGVNPGCLTFGSTVAVGCSFKGTNSTLSIYYFDGAGGGPADLITQDRTAPSTWSSATFVWDHTASPAVNSPITSGTGLDGFDLLNAFPNGVGVLIGLFDSGSSNVYTGYIGPTIIVSGRRTFSSQPMHMQRLTGHSRTSRIP